MIQSLPVFYCYFILIIFAGNVAQNVHIPLSLDNYLQQSNIHVIPTKTQSAYNITLMNPLRQMRCQADFFISYNIIRNFRVSLFLTLACEKDTLLVYNKKNLFSDLFPKRFVLLSPMLISSTFWRIFHFLYIYTGCQ